MNLLGILFRKTLEFLIHLPPCKFIVEKSTKRES